MKICPRCTQTDNAALRFCSNCGTELFFAERFKSEDEPEKNKAAEEKRLYKKLRVKNLLITLKRKVIK